MAYNIKTRNVLDLRPSIGVGVALPFDNPAVFETVYTTAEQLKYNIINFLLTDRRERIFNPNFGANIRAQLFEQINVDTYDSLEQQIRSGIENYFPNVVIVDLDVSGQPDRNLIQIKFSYAIASTGDSDTIILDLNG
jgi:phage baseplate assembly protein W